MTARRGSLRFKVAQLASGRGRGRAADLQTRLRRATHIGGRIIFVAAICLLALTFGAQAWRIAYADYQLHRQVVALEAANRVLQDETVTLRKEIYLARDPEYLVPLIHEQLGLAKPHEVFVRFETVDPVPPRDSVPPKPSQP